MEPRRRHLRQLHRRRRPDGAGAPGAAAQTAVNYAEGQLGIPCQWDAEDPGIAFDCSGLTQAAYAAAGTAIPCLAQDQYDTTPHLPAGTPLLPGDLVFCGTGPARIEHVGIYIGCGQMIYAPAHPSRRPHRPGALARRQLHGRLPSLRLRGFSRGMTIAGGRRSLGLRTHPEKDRSCDGAQSSAARRQRGSPPGLHAGCWPVAMHSVPSR
ncbi:MAG: C40 family peptidase [Streptosporangiaceae bacterium]